MHWLAAMQQRLDRSVRDLDGSCRSVEVAYDFNLIV
jgi:hypothetical protein